MKKFKATCAGCGHSSYRDALDSMYPEVGIPLEKIFYQLGDKRFSFLCTNPECHSYTISCIQQSEIERLQEKYNQ
jgi:hypothetical protein